MNSARQTVEVVVWHPDGGRVLLRPEGLPTLDVMPLADLPAALRSEWGLDTWTLHDGGRALGREERAQMQALSGEAPAGVFWGEAEVSPPPRARGWQRPGWSERARQVLDTALAHAGLTRTGELAPVHTHDLVAVLRAETSGGPVYLKASDSPHEAAVTAHLSRTRPDLLPPTLWTDPGAGLMVSASGGELLDGVAELEAWKAAVRRLARFQREADGPALDALGCPALPIAEMRERVDALLSDTDTLQAWGLEPQHTELLQAARPIIRAAFQELASLGLPDLPAHRDAHPRNALHGERGNVWFDWSEAACAAHPFMDAGWFLALALHPGRGDLPVRTLYPDLEASLSAAYLTALGCPEATCELGRSLPLALLHRAAVYDLRFRHWEGTVPGWRPNYVPYYLKQAVRELIRLA